MDGTIALPVDTAPEPTESAATLDGRAGHLIRHYNRMAPFLMSVVSDSDLWMFLSSRGGLTCGRGDAGRALFRYQTDDLLHDAHHTIGPYTRFHVDVGGERDVWVPFESEEPGPALTRSLFKSKLGNRVTFTERHDEHGLTFSYTWCNAQCFGWVRECELRLDGDATPVRVDWLDGLRCVLPAGAHRVLLSDFQCLVNAYRRSEVLPETGLAVYPLQSLIMDQAVPGEALTTNVVWCDGVERPRVVLSEASRRRFVETGEVLPEQELKGQMAHYLLHQHATLEPGQTLRWRTVADVGLDQSDVVALRSRMRDASSLGRELDEAIRQSDDELERLIAAADGLQCSNDRAAADHHLANVMFNIMRGGVFTDGYAIQRDDLSSFVAERNVAVAQKHAASLAAWPERMTIDDVLDRATSRGDADFERLCLEYLPLYFGRRHGDPSRPWNQFSIRVRKDGGSRALDYQGNWRDIFQNWEALTLSFPSFIEPVIAKFVNATTRDGYNPYRVSRAGIDWEVPEPENPWAGIGYWGDHQIIYLCKLIEWSRRVHPGKLAGWLGRAVFSFADVPYRLKPYDDILADPDDTIVFDAAAHRTSMHRVQAMGADGRLVPDGAGGVLHATLAEKLLIPVLAKLSNFVADGGIWMNTQRPEWNDANNALVGHGVSMVTLCYLRRHLLEVGALFDEAGGDAVAVSEPVAHWLREVADAFEAFQRGDERDAARPRRRLLDALGRAFDRYRDQLDNDAGDRVSITCRGVAERLRAFVPVLDETIRANRREDGLYHSYNLLKVVDGAIEVGHLYPMLEGQVAVLSSGLLTGREVLGVIDALYASELYRADQHSFMLYPRRELAAFLDRNVAPRAAVESNPLLTAVIDAGDATVIARDAAGDYRFHASLTNGRALRDALDRLAKDDRFGALVAQHGAAVRDAYEQTFNHHAFTGRSGGMYAYEGLGSIYWHMVSKLWLAIQENVSWAQRHGESPETLKRLIERYHDVRRGLSAAKTPAEYGAFPTDPYSHTPYHAGAQQPGMTGQVKEEVLTRFGELGVSLEGGCIWFGPTMLRQAEFLTEPDEWQYVDVSGESRTLALGANQLAFTLAQVPVVYRLADAGDGQVHVAVTGRDGNVAECGDTVSAEWSGEVFARSGRVVRLDVTLPRSVLI